VQATHPTRRDELPHDIAAGLIRTWLRFKVQETAALVMTGAREIKAEHVCPIGTPRLSPPRVHLAAASCSCRLQAPTKKHAVKPHYRSITATTRLGPPQFITFDKTNPKFSRYFKGLMN
jgi:hypothetical protein